MRALVWLKMLSEHCQVSLEFPSKTDFPLLVFYTCQSPSAETWKGINISTNTTSPASCSAFYFSNMNINYNADLILKYKCGAHPSRYFALRLVISTLFLESTQHSGSSNIVGKIPLADWRQTGSALDLHSSWKNDTMIYSEHDTIPQSHHCSVSLYVQPAV